MPAPAWTVTLLVAACLLAAAGCSVPRGKEAVTVVLDGPPLTLDPNAHREVVTRSVLSNCYQGLVGFDSLMRVVPLLAANWENPDDLTWVFHLRPGVRFHDGLPLDAEAAVRSIRPFIRGRNPQGARLGSLDTAYARDSATVVLKTSRPDAVLLNQLTKAYIVSDGPLRSFPCDTGMASMKAGTGPYFVESWRGGAMVMDRWPGYWGRPPEITNLILLFREGHLGTAELLRQGRADIAAGVSASDAAAISRIPGFRLLRRPGLAVRYLHADPSVKPYSDARVRRAISLALDRQALVDGASAGYGRPASQMVTEAVFGFNPGLPPLRHDPDSARALLAAAGYRNGPSLLLDVMETRRELGRMIKRQLEEAGFACSLCVHGREEFFRGTGRPSRFYLSAVASTSGDASAALSLDGRGTGSTGMMSTARRLQALQAAMAGFTARYEFIPLFSEDYISAVSDRVEWQPRQDMLVLGREIKLRSRKKEELR